MNLVQNYNLNQLNQKQIKKVCFDLEIEKEYLNNILKNNQTLKDIYNSKIKGSIEKIFLFYITSKIKSQKQAKKNNFVGFILPSFETLAKLFKCTKTYIYQLIKKYSNTLFKTKKVSKYDALLSNQYIWKYNSNFVYLIDINEKCEFWDKNKKRIDFNKLKLFINKTVKFKLILSTYNNQNAELYIENDSKELDDYLDEFKNSKFYDYWNNI